MTVTTPDLVAAPDFEPGHVGFGSLLRSEWTKLRSVRSTVWSLTLLVVLTIGLTAGIMALIVGEWGKSTATAHQRVLSDPVSTILGAGAGLGQVPVIVLGVLVMASEYSTGMIRSSLLAVPRRLPMLWAKCAVFAAVVLVVGEVTMFPSFLIGAAILHSKAAVSLSDPGVLQAVIGSGLYFAVLALFSLAIGGIVRHTAGAIAGAVAFVVIVAPLAKLLPGSVGNHIYGYLPTVAGTDIGQAHQASGQVLSAWQGFGVFCLWTALLLTAAAYLLKVRDA